MFSWKEFQKTKVILSQDSSYQDLSGQHHVTIRPVNLIRWIELAKEDLGFLTLVEVAAVDVREIDNYQYQFELTYHLLNMGSHQRLNIHVRFDEMEVVPTIIESFSHADWMEREQKEALGIRFSRPLESLLLPRDQKNYPLRKNAQLDDWPIDPARALPEIQKNPNKSEAPYPEEAYRWNNYNLFSPCKD
jgi:NADH:ubiquinone oxidoreductase subunit C